MLPIAALLLSVLPVQDSLPPALDPPTLARQIDRTLADLWKDAGQRPTATVDDATFLRRLSLDLLGTIPTRQEVAEFLDDDRPDRRERKIDEYLADPGFAQNLSLMWADVLLKEADRRPEGNALRPWLEQQFATSTPFADVVRELIAATGSSQDNGATAYVLSYRRTPEDLTSVTSRAFLGLQVQCAQCHDHPYDDWTQQQFNQMTAFFTGIRVTQDEVPDRRLPVYEVRDLPHQDRREDSFQRLLGLIRRARGEAEGTDGSMDSQDLEPTDSTDADAESSMTDMRGSNDRPISRRAMRRARRDPERAEQIVERLLAELPPEAQRRIREARDRMEQYGEPATLDGQAYDSGTGHGPREVLAEWIVAPDNPYFARAVVNRFWAHLFGKGLTEPMDDLSAATDTVLPPLLDFLADQFQRSGTDLRHLVRTLVLTDAYALSAADERDAEVLEQRERLYAAHPVRPLRADQVMAALVRTTSTQGRADRRGRGQSLEFIRRRLLEEFENTFGDEESVDGDRFEAGLPQALFMMNGRMTNDGIRVRANELLKEILLETDSDRERVRQMFLATLNRLPERAEMERVFRLVHGARGGNAQGIEDLYWALLNSSEFLTNH